MDSIEATFIVNVVKRLLSYKALGDATFAQLNDADMLFRPNAQSNSIAAIVQHLHGNMLSRFTNFLTEDGEKPWRKRDTEFDDIKMSRDEVLKLWNAGWQTVLDALHTLQPEDLTKTIYIRTEPLLVYDAILRQLAHYPAHVGQIVYIGKMIKGSAWHSLSIAKGESKTYNTSMGLKH